MQQGSTPVADKSTQRLAVTFVSQEYYNNNPAKFSYHLFVHERIAKHGTHQKRQCYNMARYQNFDSSGFGELTHIPINPITQYTTRS